MRKILTISFIVLASIGIVVAMVLQTADRVTTPPAPVGTIEPGIVEPGIVEP